MQLPRRLALVLLVLALAAAACGDDANDDAQASVATREVAHAMGATEVPADPERVVVLDSSFLDAALVLGVTPVGATEASAGFGMPEYLADRVPDIEVVGLTDEPNLEAIASLRPDLILGAKVRHEKLYEQLARIAPTVFTESSGTNWKEGLAVAADALGASDEAEELLAEHEVRADALGDEIGTESMRLSMVRFLLPDEIRLYGPKTFSGSVLTDVGFDLGDHRWDEYSMAYLSAEQLGQADGDVVLTTSYGGTETPEFTAAFGPVEPLWKRLPAVAEGRQHWVEDDIWMLGIGPIGAGLILDDIERLLVEQ
ncbi:MAG: iron-siderophore ABC transporter substrate-binding protein [Acidimicrobiales bacterium]